MKVFIALAMMLSLTACEIRIKDPVGLKDQLSKCSSIEMTSVITPLGNNDYSVKCV